MTLLRYARLALLLGSVTFPYAPAVAAEDFVYAPQDCEMQVTFPEKPFFQTKCTQAGDKEICSEIVNFTKVIDATASTNIRVSCYKGDADELKNYSPEVMKETLKQMTLQSLNVEPQDVRASEEGGFKKALSLAIASRNDIPVIYTAQIWIGKTSIFTIESEMLGPQNEEVEKAFATILRNTLPKEEAAKAAKATSQPDLKPEGPAKSAPSAKP
ncbi:MAG: hypothetical protein WC043_04275 [Pseudobdellovibrionaceae bacterium]